MQTTGIIREERLKTSTLAARRETFRKTGVAQRSTTTAQRSSRRHARPLPYHGPYQCHGGVCSIPVWDRELRTYRWAVVDVADYVLAMRRRWIFDKNGYPWAHAWDTTTKRGVALYLHRLIARANVGEQVDHVAHDLTDCRRAALRIATPSQNSANTRRLSLIGRKSSSYRGVTRHRQTGRWQAAAKHADKCHYLGLFDDEHDAAVAYDRKARELWGDFARLNFPPQATSQALRRAS